MSLLMEYVRDLQTTLAALPLEPIEQVVSILNQARLENRQVFIMGNGGSAATASHFVCDLAKNTREVGKPHFKVIGLSDNMAILSALANDEGYDNVFVQQLANLINPGDIVIAISASGNSPNVLKAIEYARETGATTIGFTGYEGGKLGVNGGFECTGKKRLY
jgi:D-sedoheptulose 7-phosphate isomerase